MLKGVAAVVVAVRNGFGVVLVMVIVILHSASGAEVIGLQAKELIQFDQQIVTAELKAKQQQNAASDGPP